MDKCKHAQPTQDVPTHMTCMPQHGGYALSNTACDQTPLMARGLSSVPLRLRFPAALYTHTACTACTVASVHSPS
jgi:hypothetical protein